MQLSRLSTLVKPSSPCSHGQLMLNDDNFIMFAYVVRSYPELGFIAYLHLGILFILYSQNLQLLSFQCVWYSLISLLLAAPYHPLQFLNHWSFLQLPITCSLSLNCRYTFATSVSLPLPSWYLNNDLLCVAHHSFYISNCTPVQNSSLFCCPFFGIPSLVLSFTQTSIILLHY